MKKEFYKKSLEFNPDFKSTCFENILSNLYSLIFIWDRMDSKYGVIKVKLWPPWEHSYTLHVCYRYWLPRLRGYKAATAGVTSHESTPELELENRVYPTTTGSKWQLNTLNTWTKVNWRLFYHLLSYPFYYYRIKFWRQEPSFGRRIN